MGTSKKKPEKQYEKHLPFQLEREAAKRMSALILHFAENCPDADTFAKALIRMEEILKGTLEEHLEPPPPPKWTLKKLRELAR